MEVAKLDDISLDAPVLAEKDLKPPAQWRLIGKDIARMDAPAKVSGRARYGMDVQIPGMLYASILHSPVATLPHPLYGDGAEAMTIEGVTHVVALPHGVAVVGTDYWATVLGKRALKVEWRKGSPASLYDSEAKKREWAAVAADRKKPGHTFNNAGNFAEAFKAASQTLSADYVTYHAHHACMEPFNATASMMYDDM